MDTLNFKKAIMPYEQAVEELKLKFKSIRKGYISLDQYSPIEFVTGRVKKMSSILAKAKAKNIPLGKIEEQIEDIAGIRIMCQFEADIEKVVEIIRGRHRKDMTVVEERDYITNVKPSGYRSYHVIVRYPVQTAVGERVILAEIQIRTLAMNFWATIEHSLNYKYQKNIPLDIQKRLNNAAQAAYKLDKEMMQIRDDVLLSQQGFREESSVVDNIYANIQTLAKRHGDPQMNTTYEEFWEVWDKNSIDELRDFNGKLEEEVKKKT